MPAKAEENILGWGCTILQVNTDKYKMAVREIKSRLRISEVLKSEGAKVSGSKGMCKCLFHHEGIPSFSFDDEKGMYNCFSCGSKGSVINLIKDCEKKLHSHYLKTNEDAVEFIIGLYPEIAESLGFKSIFIKIEEIKDLPRKEDGSLDFEFRRQYKPKYARVVTQERTAKMLLSKLRASEAKCRAVEEADKEAIEEQKQDAIQDILTFISCCEYEITPESTQEILEGVPFDMSVGQTHVEVTEDILDAFSELL